MATGVVVAIICWLLSFLPKRLDGPTISEDKVRDHLFKIIHIAGGAFAIFSILFTYNSFVNERENMNAERFASATKDLGGKDSTEILRIGALYSLEQVAQDSPHKYANRVLDVISAFIREKRNRQLFKVLDHTSANYCQTNPLPSDVRTALKIISYRGYSNGTSERMIDLSNSDLACADFGKAYYFTSNYHTYFDSHTSYTNEKNWVSTYMTKFNLKFIDFSGSVLTDADLSYSHFYKSVFKDAVLIRTNLHCADLRGVEITDANLTVGTITDSDESLLQLCRGELEK